jgi:magnesium transporter
MWTLETVTACRTIGRRMQVPPTNPLNRLNECALDHARTDFIQILADRTLGEAVAQIQQQEVGGRIVYFYVVDRESRLQGVLPIRRVLLNPPETPVADVMVRNVVALPATATLFDACEQFILHRFLALPIVDKDRRVLGVVDVELYTDEISDLARREESDDVFQLIGVRLAEVQQASPLAAFRGRFPWLLCNIGGGLACAMLAWQFEGVLDKVIVLSLFIPVVLAVAESVSIQTLSLAVQAHHGNRFQWGETLRAFRREIPVGVMLGIASGGLIGLVVLVWRQMGLVALSILLSISLAMTTAVFLGLLVPTILHTIQRDPKVASGPIVLAMTDLATLFYYLGTATVLLG